jgi:hypothetical protein
MQNNKREARSPITDVYEEGLDEAQSKNECSDNIVEDLENETDVNDAFIKKRELTLYVTLMA